MLDLQMAFQTILLIVLIVLVASLYSSVQALRREVRELKRSAGDRPPTESQEATYAQVQRPVGPPPPQIQNIRVPQATAYNQPRPQVQPKADAHLRPRPMPQQAPRPQAAPPHPPQQQPTADQQEHASLENVLGTRVLGIMAALLVFAGLVFLAILVVPALTDEVRCAAMFVLSGSLAVAGILITERKKTPFSLALLGCGLGSVFVSLLVTYVHFGYLSIAPTAALMLIWLAACMFLAKRHGSAMLVVVAQIGMAVSTCFAYIQGVDTGQLPLVIAYQLMACIIVVVGCVKSLDKGRLVGSFVCMVVSLVVSLIVSATYTYASRPMEELVFLATMGTQLVTVTVLALVTDILRNKGADQPSPMDTAIHVSIEVLWFASLLINVSESLLLVGLGPSLETSIRLSALVSLGCVGAHWLTSVILQKLRVFNERLTTISVCFCATVATFLLVWRIYATPRHDVISLVVLVAIALWLTGIALRSERYKSVSVGFLGADALLMAAGGYELLNAGLHAPVSVAYVIVLDCLLFAWWRFHTAGQREKLLGNTLLAGTVATEISLFCAWTSTSMAWELAVPAAFACCLTLVALIAFAEPQRRASISNSIGNTLFVNEFVLIALSCLAVVDKGLAYYARVSPAAPALAAGICLVSFGIILYRCIHMAASADTTRPWRQVLLGILLTLWATCSAAGMLPSNMAAVTTIVAMLSALVCIALGFVKRLGALRLYGLVTTILCVLKIVTIDVSGSDSVGRVVAFIVGGLICFAISAVYTIAVRRLER